MSQVASLAGLYRIPDLRRRLLFTLALLAAYRLGSHIPIPGIHLARWEELVGANSAWSFLDLLAGGGLSRLAVFALGITPYISASILLQIFTVSFPALARLEKEGELGRRKITRWTRYLAIILALLYSLTAAQTLQAVPGLVLHPGFGFTVLTVSSLTAGAALAMWLGEQITERGLGNGISLLIFAGIVARLPQGVADFYANTFVTREWGPLTLGAILAAVIAVFAFVVLVERAERRLEIHYARRIRGRALLGGQAAHLPLKLNGAGVMPVIFASSLLAVPQTLAGLPLARQHPWFAATLAAMRHGEPLYYVLLAAGILFFSFFYTSIVFHPAEVADQLRRHGGFLSGVRPGPPTAASLDAVLTRLTVAGAFYLTLVCLAPDLLVFGIRLQHLPLIGNWFDAWAPRPLLEGFNLHFYFGGTSLLIVVGVAMDLVKQVESHLLMRHYEGFTGRPVRSRARLGAG